jgi:NADH-quinone oxidoreductase subunit K
MLGPDVAWYLAIAAFLFTVGALGVLLRRNPLIILLSLELMLNAANLTLIAFARQHESLDGQIFALAVMAVAASEVVVGLGLVVAMARRKVALLCRIDEPGQCARVVFADRGRRLAQRAAAAIGEVLISVFSIVGIVVPASAAHDADEEWIVR